MKRFCCVILGVAVLLAQMTVSYSHWRGSPAADTRLAGRR